MIKIDVPGKLFLIGEYAVMNPGNEAVLISVNRFLSVTVNNALSYEFNSSKGRFKWMLDEGLPSFRYDELKHAKAAIYIAHSYLNHVRISPHYYKIDVTSMLDDVEGQKYGLGSSGAILIGLIKAILLYHGVIVSKLQLFKLCVLAQLQVNDLTSGGELAVSIYTGWVSYKRYNAIWLFNNKGRGIEIIDDDWPMLEIKKLVVNKFFPVVCYSGITQSTKEYVDKVLAKDIKNGFFKSFCAKAKLTVAQFRKALISGDLKRMKQAIAIYRQLMLDLQDWAEIKIESEVFIRMIQLSLDEGYACKVSGAGYGDCGISVVDDLSDKDKLFKVWEKEGLMPLDVKVWEGFY